MPPRKGWLCPEQYDGAANDIQRLAAEGFSLLGIAAHFKVSGECFKRWLEEDEALNDAFELGRETERQALHALVVASAKANKPANVNAFFLLKARHGYVETDNRTKVTVDVAVSNVLVVKDLGTVEEWAAKAAAQQRALTAECTSPLQIEGSCAPQVDAVALSEPPANLAPVYAPQAAPVATAPSWVAPVFPWESQPAPAPVYAPEPIPTAPVAPSWTAEWRPRT